MDPVVEFQDAADVQKVVLYNSTTDEEYDVIEHPPGPARFQVVFPDQMDTYIVDSLHVRAKTPNGWAEEWISEIGHANLRKFGCPIW